MHVRVRSIQKKATSRFVEANKGTGNEDFGGLLVDVIVMLMMVLNNCLLPIWGTFVNFSRTAFSELQADPGRRLCVPAYRSTHRYLYHCVAICNKYWHIIYPSQLFLQSITPPGNEVCTSRVNCQEFWTHKDPSGNINERVMAFNLSSVVMGLCARSQWSGGKPASGRLFVVYIDCVTICYDIHLLITSNCCCLLSWLRLIIATDRHPM